MSRPVSEPTCQNRNSSSAAAFVVSTAIVTATSSALTAAPDSASFTGVAPPRPAAAIAYTATAAAPAPTKANQTYPPRVCTPRKDSARTTATEAP